MTPCHGIGGSEQNEREFASRSTKRKERSTIFLNLKRRAEGFDRLRRQHQTCKLNEHGVGIPITTRVPTIESFDRFPSSAFRKREKSAAALLKFSERSPSACCDLLAVIDSAGDSEVAQNPVGAALDSFSSGVAKYELLQFPVGNAAPGRSTPFRFAQLQLQSCN